MRARIAVLFVVVTCTTAFAATALAAPAAQSKASAGNCVVVASGNKNFSTLVALVKQAGLVKTLSGKGPFTIMAPTNAAFAKLKKTAPATFKAVTTDKALLTKVLTYHVIPFKMSATTAISTAKDNAKVATVQGEPIALSLKGARCSPTERQGHRSQRQVLERHHPRHQQRARSAERLVAPNRKA